jgi:hypothetical protein
MGFRVRDWRFEDAAQKMARLGVEGLNREVADYWLALWSGDTPPLLSSFDPFRIATHLRSVAMVEVRLRQSAICRAAGGNLRSSVGYDLTGKDVVALVPQHQRREMMRVVEDIVLGSIVVADRPFLRADGRVDLIQEIALPFADPSVDGSLRYLIHTNWRPRGEAERALGQARTDTHLARHMRAEELT